MSTPPTSWTTTTPEIGAAAGPARVISGAAVAGIIGAAATTAADASARTNFIGYPPVNRRHAPAKFHLWRCQIIL
jgi:hypothetical protein